MSLLKSKFQNILFYVILFCYIFSFYVFIPVAYIIMPFLILFFLINCKIRVRLGLILGEARILFIFLFLFILFILSLLFSLFHQTFDFTHSETLFNQISYLVIGLFIGACFFKKFANLDIIKVIIGIFVVQSIIQVFVFLQPSIQDIMFFFNKADDFASDGYKGIRGLALASGTGWNLSLAYGLIFILLFYYSIIRNRTSIMLAYLIILIVGCSFAGRTGYLGIFLGLILYLSISNIYHKIKLSIYLPLVSLILLMFLTVMPSFYYSLEEKIFPFLFEFYYNYEHTGRIETGSTSVLLDMWNVEFDSSKIFLGYGYFTDPITGSYFKKVDVGVLRNLFYWGGTGYIMIIMYQIYFLYNVNHYMSKFESKSVSLVLLIFFYLAIAEMKAMTLGFNKMVISILFVILLSYVIKNIVYKNEEGSAS